MNQIGNVTEDNTLLHNQQQHRDTQERTNMV